MRCYLWLNGRLIGRIAGGQVAAVHTDQVGRPEVVTDASHAVIWRAQNFAFGQTVVAGNITLNLGFPASITRPRPGCGTTVFVLGRAAGA